MAGPGQGHFGEKSGRNGGGGVPGGGIGDRSLVEFNAVLGLHLQPERLGDVVQLLLNKFLGGVCDGAPQATPLNILVGGIGQAFMEEDGW